MTINDTVGAVGFLQPQPPIHPGFLQSEDHTFHLRKLLEQASSSGGWIPTWLKVYLVIQAIFGIVAFEWAWSKTKNFRVQDEIKFYDPRLIDVRRTDPKRWARWKFYPGAMFLLLTRIIFIGINALILWVLWKMCIMCYNFEKHGPIRKGCRHSTIGFFGRQCARIHLFFCGMASYHTEKDADYSYYLGPNYKEQMNTNTTSTIVCNHVSWLDSIIFGRRFMPMLAPKESMKKVPIANVYADAQSSLYIPRGPSRADKDKILKIIQERQQLIEESNGTLAPLLIFPEGTTSNGKQCYLFKKGAFLAEKKIKPYIINYSDGQFNPAWEVIDFFPYVLMFLCWGGYTCHLTTLPDFQPNEYLFKTHADKGEERWEIYAWALREIIMEHGNLKGSTLSYRLKRTYSMFMNNHKKAIHPDHFNEDDITHLTF